MRPIDYTRSVARFDRQATDQGGTIMPFCTIVEWDFADAQVPSPTRVVAFETTAYAVANEAS